MTFAHHGVLVRTDLFFREGDRYRFTEVKSSASVKPHYAMDAAIQTWVLRSCGVPVEQVRLAHVDKTFTYDGDGDYSGLLTEVDITEEVDELVPQVPGHLVELRGC